MGKVKKIISKATGKSIWAAVYGNGETYTFETKAKAEKFAKKYK